MDELQNENQKLKEKIQELEERLSKYTNPQRVKIYQDRHKEIISEKKKFIIKIKKKKKLKIMRFKIKFIFFT
mgnify:CR=1 FL=1